MEHPAIFAVVAFLMLMVILSWVGYRLIYKPGKFMRQLGRPVITTVTHKAIDGSENVPSPEFCSLSCVIWYRAVKELVGVSCTSTLGLKFVRVRGFEIDSVMSGIAEVEVSGETCPLDSRRCRAAGSPGALTWTVSVSRARPSMTADGSALPPGRLRP